MGPMGRNQKLASAAAADPGSRFQQDILQRFCVRRHMALIVGGTFFSGLLASKLMHLLGVQAMAIRYPLAVLASYLAFFALVRLWIACVLPSRRAHDKNDAPDAVDFDVNGDVGSSGGSTLRSGGGSSGGAGATGNWDASEVTVQAIAPSTSGGGSGGLSSSGFDSDVDSDSVVVIVAFVALAAILLSAGAYVVYIAPEILLEAAFQAALATGLVRPTKKLREADWVGGVFKRTWWLFVLVALAAFLVGSVVSSVCPNATKASDAWPHCQTRPRVIWDRGRG
jgi:hypothetical protein